MSSRFYVTRGTSKSAGFPARGAAMPRSILRPPAPAAPMRSVRATEDRRFPAIPPPSSYTSLAVGGSRNVSESLGGSWTVSVSVASREPATMDSLSIQAGRLRLRDLLPELALRGFALGRREVAFHLVAGVDSSQSMRLGVTCLQSLICADGMLAVFRGAGFGVPPGSCGLAGLKSSGRTQGNFAGRCSLLGDPIWSGDLRRKAIHPPARECQLPDMSEPRAP